MDNQARDRFTNREVEQRVEAARGVRITVAQEDARVPAAKNVANGDEAMYADKGGTYTKGLPHDDFGRVRPDAYESFKKALNSGKFADFEAIKLGGTRTLNGPQGGLTFDLVGLDPIQFGQPEVPPAPPVASDQSATELLEHYWASLLRDVAFTDYAGNALAAEAASELGAQSTYLGPRDAGGHVTPDLLSRGSFPGEQLGPHVSQFFLQPAAFGAQPLSQMMESLVPNVDFMTTFADWLTVQNGNLTAAKIQKDPQLRYRRNGRDLAAYTHVDVLFQAYLTALLVADTIGVPVNPGNPYARSKTENGFGSFGGPDFTGTLCEVATRALNAVWLQKWMVHLRPRPEATGGIVHLIKSGQADKTDVKQSNVILNSKGLQRSFEKNKSWLLSQAFPEGSPMHPSYPTGHGTVGGACITVMKFFYDCSQKIRPLLGKVNRDVVVPSADGLSLQPYTGADRDRLDINGELAKLAHNVSLGHGVHAGIHWRSDTDTSILLGEAVALAFLRSRAQTYNEPFTVNLTKFDGTTATIANTGDHRGGRDDR